MARHPTGTVLSTKVGASATNLDPVEWYILACLIGIINMQARGWAWLRPRC